MSLWLYLDDTVVYAGPPRQSQAEEVGTGYCVF